MKKILPLLFVLLVATSCVTFKTPYRSYSNAIDFSSYTRNGFFITESNSVNFPYEPLGSITSVVTSGYEVISGNKAANPKDDIYTQNSKVKYGRYIDTDVNKALDELCNSARQLGADGIINFHSEYVPAKYQKGTSITPDSYIVSGMAIRRK